MLKVLPKGIKEMMRKGRCFNEGDWMDEIPKVIIRSIKT